MGGSKKKTGGCCSTIFGLGLTAVLLWLWLQTSNPKCSVQTLYLPSLNRALNLTTDPTLTLSLRVANPNKAKGIKYDPLNLTVYDFLNQSHVLGKVLVPSFYQGYRKKATKQGQGIANTTMALATVSEDGIGVFWVDLTTKVKFKILFWYTKKHTINVGANVVVNASGVKVAHEDIRLESMAPTIGSFFVVGTLMNFLIFILFNF